jgi:5'-nucleotidase
MDKPLILVTNDDGIFAPGIKALVDVVKKIGTPVVVAPDKPQSGQGHAITITSPLRLEKVDQFDGVQSYACSGTPVDCVKLAKNILFKDQTIDLCVSGVNHGSNAALNILYSGTMSAAMEASIEGINSIGFSLLDFSFEADFSATMHYSEILIKRLLKEKQKSILLNVNIPKLPLSDIKGMKICKQGEGRWVENYKENIDPRGGVYYWLDGEFEKGQYDEDSDLNALKNGYISIVPSQHDLTDYKNLQNLSYLEA